MNPPRLRCAARLLVEPCAWAVCMVMAVASGAWLVAPARAHAAPRQAAAAPRPAAPPPAAPPVVAPVPSGATAWATTEDRWYEVLLGGKACGYSRETTEERDGLVRTTSLSELRLGRMGQGVVVKTTTVFVETAGGRPVEAAIVRETGAAPIRTRWLFNSDSIDIIDEQGDRTDARRAPLPGGDWLTPAKAREFVRRRVAAGARDLAYSTLDPQAGPTLVQVKSARTGAGALAVEGKQVPTTRWETRNTIIDKPSIEELSSDGVIVRSTTDVGVGVLEARLSTRAAATQARGSVEVMAKTFVPLKQDGAALLRARTAHLRLRAPGTLMEFPSTGAQRFTRTGAGAGTLDIDMGVAQSAERGDDADQRYRRASVMVDSNDAGVRALADAALRGAGTDPLARTSALRAAVARHLTNKNLASGFATASEAVASRAGDCTEHAVLLAACLRHAGIPARVVSGLVYVKEIQGVRNVYGWHMWAQALVNGAWVDADAVLPPDGPLSHAGHLAVVATAAEGAGMDMELARIVELIGALEIDIVNIDGVPATANPPRAQGAGAAP